MASIWTLLVRTGSLLALFLGVAGSDTKASCQHGPQAACECLLACDVFGGNAALCDSHQGKKAVVREAVNTHLQEERTLCDGMGCVVACSKKLGCLDETIKDKCQSTARGNPGCNLNCNDGRRGAIATQALMFFVGISGLVAATAGTPLP
eukprot:CAMPEP_0172725350 /NCGR_PEP_ID=MMETSP1074-20121228/88166_1 /TAXON_ID=2916 /ORGANISM="Ceratium fusus, Strain PA161109" /LENGTH=149 /DNA_ID=CAMNT_0013552097 /DNA_START=42 /DNA_END=491 /DNA_ORIENTATION=+